jgi:hypothetical protein
MWRSCWLYLATLHFGGSKLPGGQRTNRKDPIDCSCTQTLSNRLDGSGGISNGNVVKCENGWLAAIWSGDLDDPSRK